MPIPYSKDLRKRVIAAINSGKSVAMIVTTYDIGKSTVYNWKNMYQKTGSYEPMPQNAGRKSKVTNEKREKIKEKILEQPDITLEELKENLDLSVCISALCRIVNNKLNLRYKKNTSLKRTK